MEGTPILSDTTAASHSFLVRQMLSNKKKENTKNDYIRKTMLKMKETLKSTSKNSRNPSSGSAATNHL